MTKVNKILLTVPSLIILGSMVIYFYPAEFNWLIPTMKEYYILVGFLNTLMIVQLIIIIRSLWSFRNLEKSAKIEWTIYLIIFNTIAILIMIWSKLDEFERMNENNTPDNT